MPTSTQRITPNLWFDTQAEDAARFYVSVFKDAKISTISRYGSDAPGPEGSVMVVELRARRPELRGAQRRAGVHDQRGRVVRRELRHPGGSGLLLGPALGRRRPSRRRCAAGSRTSSACRGRSCRRHCPDYVGGPDPEGARRAMQAMLKMKKLDIAALQAAPTTGRTWHPRRAPVDRAERRSDDRPAICPPASFSDWLRDIADCRSTRGRGRRALRRLLRVLRDVALRARRPGGDARRSRGSPGSSCSRRPDTRRGTLLMGYDGTGRCPMLGGGRCSIYEDRPRTCRTYDCRVFAAAGIAADRDPITRQARRWEFGHPTRQDRDEHAAVRAAARFLRERAECFPAGRAARPRQRGRSSRSRSSDGVPGARRCVRRWSRGGRRTRPHLAR